MATISDLSCDLVEEILIRVPLTCLGAVRSTCKRWNNLSKSRLLYKAEAEEQFLGFMITKTKLCSLRFNVHEEFTVKKILDSSNRVKISEVLVCDGLLLCVTVDYPNEYCIEQRLMLWNPYLGQKRWIQPRREPYDTSDVYALGYDDKSTNRNHKILRCCYMTKECEIYDVKSDSWRTLGGDVTLHWDWGEQYYFHLTASLKGNTYFLDHVHDRYDKMFTGFLVCFDFTTERFGEQLHLPWSQEPRVTPISCFREEKLAALNMTSYVYGVGIWVTTKTEPNELLWSKFFDISLEAIPCNVCFGARSFFIDEEKKRVVVFSVGSVTNTKSEEEYHEAAYVIGENDYFKTVDLGGTRSPHYCFGPVVCSNSYVPSLVQIKQRREKKKRKQL